MTASSDNKEDLIAGAQRGDRQAIERLLEPLYTRLYSFICRCVGGSSTADDVFQDCVLKVVQNVRNFVAGNFQAWVFTIARNLCMDVFRRQRDVVSLDAPIEGTEELNLKQLVGAIGSVPGGEFDAKIEELELQQALEKLPPEQKEVVLLRMYGGFSFKEVAKITGCPLGTALARMSYALKALQKMLANK